MECYIQWRKGFYVVLLIQVCLVLVGDVNADLDPCSSALLCDKGTQTAKYRTCHWQYSVKIIENPYCTSGCVNCSKAGIGMPRNLTYNISELQPGRFFQISWSYSESAAVTNLRGFLIQLFLSTASKCIRINQELCILVDLRQFHRICTRTVDGFPADFYLNCFYNGTPNAAIKTVVSSYPQTDTCFLEATLPSPHEPTTGRAEKLTPTISSVPSAVTTTTIAVASVVGVLIFSIVIGTFLFFVNKGFVCYTKAGSREEEVNHIMEEAELGLEMENLKGQVEKTKKEKSLTNKILKKQKLILENNKREIETIRSETNVTDERSNDLDRRESLMRKNESYGARSSRRLQDEDTVNDLSTPISHVSSRQSTLAQDAIPVDDLYDEYNRQLIAFNMD